MLFQERQDVGYVVLSLAWAALGLHRGEMPPKSAGSRSVRGPWSSAKPMSNTEFDPEYVFQHHPATPDKLVHFDAIHEGAKRFAEVILNHTPEGADQRTALRRLREAAMIANAAVALDGKLR
jgi:hypothetical protein